MAHVVKQIYQVRRKMDEEDHQKEKEKRREERRKRREARGNSLANADLVAHLGKSDGGTSRQKIVPSDIRPIGSPRYGSGHEGKSNTFDEEKNVKDSWD